jgi:hypothetical protein
MDEPTSVTATEPVVGLLVAPEKWLNWVLQVNVKVAKSCEHTLPLGMPPGVQCRSHKSGWPCAGEKHS